MSEPADPLHELCDFLRTGKTPPFDWVVEHAPDGTLQDAWDACDDARWMLVVYTFANDGAGLLDAVHACIAPVIAASESRMLGRRFHFAADGNRIAWEEEEGLGNVEAPGLKSLSAYSRIRDHGTATDRSYKVENAIYQIVLASSFVTVPKIPDYDPYASRQIRRQEALVAALATAADIVRSVLPVAPDFAELTRSL